MNKLRNFLGVLGVLSAVSTFFGLRGFLRWLRQRPEYQAEYHTPAAGTVPSRAAPQTTSYTGMRGFSPIPATGPEETGLGGAIPTPHQMTRSESERDTEDWARGSGSGPLDSSTEGPTGATPRVVPGEIPHTASAAPPSTEEMAVAMGVDGEVIETPARMPSQRGEPGTPEASIHSTATVAGIDAGPLDLPLVEALIAQDDLMAVIRERRAGHYRDPDPSPSSLTPVDRMRFQHAVDRLADAMGRVDVIAFQPGSGEERAHRIIQKVHDALSHLQYTDDDLILIDAEVRAEACEALRSIQRVVDWDKAYAIYGCS